MLHCFQKKAQQISTSDLEFASKRYRALLQELGHE
ncbi:hypothetical protein [Bordetella tumbae]